MDRRCEVLLIGGRSGVGKSTVGAEVSRLLIVAKTRHCYIEGDNLCAGYPPPGEQATENNLASVWANYAALGYRRLIYVNTASVTDQTWMQRALGGEAMFVGALLTASDDTADARLSRREIGGGLDWHARRSRLAAPWLEERAPKWVARVDTNGRSVADIAAQLVRLTGWLDRPGALPQDAP